MLRALVAGTAAAVLLAGCASAAPPVPAPTASPAPDGRLVGHALVIDDGSGPTWCLGTVFQSLPPQCSGPRLLGWTWPDDAERASGVTWADGELLGTYDGRRFTVTRSLDAAETARLFPPEVESGLTSPCPEPPGGSVCATRGQHTAAELSRIQYAVNRPPGFLTSESGPDDVELTVVHDDGSLQRKLDSRYGPGVVRVRSALRPYQE